MSANNYNVTDQLGFLQLSDTGAILTSGGELQV